jgi:hypothetical protein
MRGGVRRSHGTGRQLRAAVPRLTTAKAFRGGSNGKAQELRVGQCVRIERRGSGSSAAMGNDCARAAGAVLGRSAPEAHTTPSAEAMAEDFGADIDAAAIAVFDAIASTYHNAISGAIA